jgi:hypothetical protein
LIDCFLFDWVKTGDKHFSHCYAGEDEEEGMKEKKMLI